MSQVEETRREERSFGARPPRVVLEAPDGQEGALLWRLLKEEGYEVSWCPGPEGPPAVWCPLMSGRRCDFIDAADVVVSALGFDNPACRDVLGRFGSVHRDARVVVTATSADEEKWSNLLEGHRVLRAPFSSSELVEAIESVRSAVAASRTTKSSEDGR